MSNLLEKASIITTPTAYSDGKLHSVKPVQTLGNEDVVNGDFENGSANWIEFVSATFENSSVIFSNNSKIAQYDVGIVDRNYNIVIDFSDISGDGLTILVGNSNTFVDFEVSDIVNNGNKIIFNNKTFLGTGHLFIYSKSSSTSATITNVSAKEVINADFDFQRGSSATRVNSQGLIENVQTLSGNLVQNGDFSEIGSELVTNGDFATDSDWNLENTWTIENGIANGNGAVGSAEELTQPNTFTLGKTYKVVYEILNYVSGNIQFQFSGSSTLSGTTRSSNGTYTEYVVATANHTLLKFKAGSAFNGSIDNVSVKEVGQNWSLGSSNVSIQEGKAVYINQSAGNNGIYQNVLSQNKKYKVSFDVSNYQSGEITAWAGGSQNSLSNDVVSGNGLKTIKIENSGSTNGFLVFGNNSTGNYSLDNISVVEITDDTDLPRIDYTDGCGSLLLEPERTNLITNSESLSNFAKTNITEVSGNQVTPDGTLGSIKITPTSSSLAQIQKTSLTIGSAYSISFFVKKDEASHLIINQAGSSATKVSYDIDNLTYIGIAGVNANIVSYGNGWVRIEYSVNSITYGDIRIILSNGTDAYPYNPPVGDGLYLWGFQLEQNSYPTSYIPTNGSISTRLADVCNNSGSSDLINSTEGVLYTEIATFEDTMNFEAITLSDGTTNNEVRLYFSSTQNKLSYNLKVNGVTQLDGNLVGVVFKNNNKISIKYKQNNSSLWVNGFKLLSYNSLDVCSNNVLNEISFSRGGSSSPFYGKVKSVAVFKEALTDEELEYITSYRSLNELVTALKLNTL
jgi:hypothetical protein